MPNAKSVSDSNSNNLSNSNSNNLSNSDSNNLSDSNSNNLSDSNSNNLSDFPPAPHWGQVVGLHWGHNPVVSPKINLKGGRDCFSELENLDNSLDPN